MKKFLTLFTVSALAFAAAISFTALSLTGCIAMAEVVAANAPARHKYTMRSIALRNDAYQNVFKETGPGTNEIKIFICTKAELDAYFELAKAQRNSTVEDIPKRGLSLSDIGDRLQKVVDRGYLSVARKNEMLNALDNGNCAIYTTTITINNLPAWEIDGFLRE